MKINNVLTTCHDQEILSAVRSIIQNMIACEDTSQQQLHYLQSCGFGGLWRFAGPFNKVNKKIKQKKNVFTKFKILANALTFFFF